METREGIDFLFSSRILSSSQVALHGHAGKYFTKSLEHGSKSWKKVTISELLLGHQTASQSYIEQISHDKKMKWKSIRGKKKTKKRWKLIHFKHSNSCSALRFPIALGIPACTMMKKWYCVVDSNLRQKHLSIAQYICTIFPILTHCVLLHFFSGLKTFTTMQ